MVVNSKKQSKKQYKTEKSDLDFQEVVGDIVTFLNPVWQAIITEDEFFGKWDKDKSLWQ